MAADARLGRLITSNATNPNFTISDLGSQFSLGETAAYIIFLGDPTSGEVQKALVEYLFGTIPVFVDGYIDCSVLMRLRFNRERTPSSKPRLEYATNSHWAHRTFRYDE